MASTCSMMGSGQVVVGGILKERAKCRQAGVVSMGAVAPLLLQVIEEAQDQLRIEVGQGRPGGRLSNRRLGEVKQQSEGIAVGGDGARTDGSLIAQMLDGKAFQQDGECQLGVSHDDPLQP
ncbi:hypothetical protein X759_33615 [Mesorhizobium sp. LSHC420B00]|nr:hypothetical protein X759_33615 [Mesorhizobium sp. LSHC420B00]